MEYQFENRNTISRNQLIELYRYNYQSGTRRSALILGTAVLLMAVLTISTGFDLLFVALTGILIAALVNTFKRAEKDAVTAYEKRLAYYDDVMAVTCARFADKIYIEVGNTTDVVEYRKIDKVISLENSYVIFTKAPGSLTLSRDGFTKGTFSEFKQFLREKRPDLTIPD